MEPIYLDHNASTPVPERVRDAVARALAEGFGNPSASHPFGRRAKELVERARAEVAALLGCEPASILFTSGGTEATNLALRGHAAALGRAPSVVTTAVEHPATSEALSALGAPVTALPVGASGAIDPADAAVALAAARGPVLVSAILAQNETGVIQPVAALARLAKERGEVVVHADAAQAVGKIPVDVEALGVDLLSVAGHKLYAPKGVGALYVRPGTRLAPLLRGAGHERGLRPGTENVAGIAGLGEACALAREDLAAEASRQKALRDRLEAALGAAGFVVHGKGPRLPNTLNGRFPGVAGSALLARVPELAFTTGSACHAGTEHPSAVLLAMGLAASDALGAIRLSLGRGTTEADVDRAAALLVRAARG